MFLFVMPHPIFNPTLHNQGAASGPSDVLQHSSSRSLGILGNVVNNSQQLSALLTETL